MVFKKTAKELNETQKNIAKKKPEFQKKHLGARLEMWAAKSREREAVVYGTVGVGATIIVISFFFFRDVKQLFTILNLVGAAIAMGPSTAIRYREYSTLKHIESIFPQFLNDIVEATNAGQTLPQAIKSASKNEYGPLTPYVKKIAAQIDWGIPFDQILSNLAETLNSKLLSRTVSTIIETHRSGGNISDVLRAVNESIVEIDRIREERKAHVYSQMVTGYTIYFIFLGVIVGMQKFLIPTLLLTGRAEIVGVPVQAGLGERYQFLFQNLIVIQGFFSGLAIGKMSEGSLIAGLKHIVVLSAVGGMAIVLLL